MKTKWTPQQIQEIARMRVHAFGLLAIERGVQDPKAPDAPTIRETTEVARAILLMLPNHVRPNELSPLYTIDAKATNLGAGVYEIRFFVKHFE